MHTILGAEMGIIIYSHLYWMSTMYLYYLLAKVLCKPRFQFPRFEISHFQFPRFEMGLFETGQFKSARIRPYSKSQKANL